MPAGPCGFTLVEVLLALALVVALVAACSLSLLPLRQEAAFKDDVQRLEAAFRMARAEASRIGVRIRLAGDAHSGLPRLTWEPSPLEAPGRFVDYTTATWAEMVRLEHLRVISCRLASPTAANWAGAKLPGARIEQPMDALTFQPDGSVDAATLIVAPRDEGDTRRAVVEISPLGRVSSRIMTDVEFEQYLSALEESAAEAAL